MSMPQATRTFRIFVSSTFSDLKEERDALQKETFPKLREYCMERGCRFQAIDLRWGVSAEAGRDQRTMRICQEELRRSQDMSPRPNFIVLLGDRYGWRPLPEVIPADEFEQIRKLIPEGEDKDLLLSWYERDDNAIPPEYFLKPRELIISEDATEEERKRLEEEEAEEWIKIEARLIPLLREAASKIDLSEEDRTKYVTSATEQEIENGAMHMPEHVPKAEKHVFCFFRNLDLESLPFDEGTGKYDLSARDFVNVKEDGKPDPGARERLDSLQKNLKGLFPEDLPERHVFEYDVRWTGSEPPISTDHIKQLCDDVYDSLHRVIKEEIDNLESVDDMEREEREHEGFRDERAKHFTGRKSILATIADYVAGSDPHPLAVWGEGGSGKSALAAYAIQKARADHPDARVLFRFIGATPSSSDIRSLLESLCHRINGVYGGEETVPSSYEDLVDDFPKRLALATAGRPLILFIDSLDQLSEANNAKSLVWFPRDLPANVRLITTTRRGEELAALCNKLPEENVIQLEPMPRSEGEVLLEKWLADAGRTLQDFQREEVLAKFSSAREEDVESGQSGNPLYLRMAFEEARRWTSSEKDVELSPDVVGIMGALYKRLSDEGNHGAVLTSHGLGYLAASRHGLSEDEIMDVLSRDQAVMESFRRRSPNSPPVDRLPVAVWSRLYSDLEPYLAERTSEGATLLTFYHRELGDVAEEDFLEGDTGKERHSFLAEYFNSQGDPEGKGYRDETKEWDRWQGNTRALSELPYHTTMAEMWDELFATLTDFRFLENKAERANITEFEDPKSGESVKVYGGVFDIQEDYNRALEHFPTS